MRTLSRRSFNRKTVAAKTEATAVEFWSGAAIGQSEIADDQVSACLRRETLAVRLCTMRGEKSSVAPALNVCLWRRKADEIASSSHHDRLSANVRFCNLRFCCDVDVHSKLDIRHQSDYRWRTGQSVSPTAESAMRVASRPCVRDRAYGVVAGSLIASRSQFAHAAYKTPHFEILELFFLQSVIPNKFVLDRIALSGEPSKQALGKVAPIGATQFANSFLTALFRRSLDKRACCVGRGLWRFKIFGSAICSPRRARMSWSRVRC